MPDLPCELCGHTVPIERTVCPHCGRPSRFPNVLAARAAEEREALDRRYEAARREAAERGCGEVLGRFEPAMERAGAVIARPLAEADRLATSDQELYSTFYKLLEADIRLPHGNAWDRIRRKADEELFSGYKEEIRFGTLSLDGVGLGSYGECSLALRDDMIAHRASVFEENSAIFVKRHGYELPPGHRVEWERRGRLAVAKLAAALTPESDEASFARLLLSSGVTAEDDHFVEVHVFGPMSIRTFARVTLSTGKKPPPAAGVLQAFQERLERFGVAFEVRA